MADVWRARDEQDGRPVAVKLLHPHLVPDEMARQRLRAEGRLAASLRHRGIVQVYDVEPDGDTPALVMELVDGESLDLRLARDGALPARGAARIAADVADALSEAHQKGIVHRDVKPSNILVGPDGRARLADFGIAQSVGAAAEALTMTGMVMGTLRYMAPEQLAGDDVGPRTDLFGLGAVLFELLTGQPPFDASSPLSLAAAHEAGPPGLPGVDEGLATIARSCLAPEAEERPRDAAAVATSLRVWLAHGADAAPLAVAASPAARAAVTETMPVVAAMPSPPTPEEVLESRFRRALPVAFGSVSLVVLVLLVAVVLGDRSSAKGGQVVPSASPVAGWLTPLMAEYANACGTPLDPASVAALPQAEAESQLAALTDACSAEAGGGSGGSGGKGGKHGNGRGHGHRS
jgi:serine/threonine-protein kinase